MGKSSRTKGHGFERKMAGEFRDIGFHDAKRHLEYQGEEANGIDLDGTGIFKVQLKKHKAYVSINTIHEVQCGEGDIPLLITAGDRLEPMVALRWSDFKRIIESHLLNDFLNNQKNPGI